MICAFSWLLREHLVVVESFDSQNFAAYRSLLRTHLTFYEVEDHNAVDVEDFADKWLDYNGLPTVDFGYRKEDHTVSLALEV